MWFLSPTATADAEPSTIVTVDSFASTENATTTPTWGPTYAREPLLPLSLQAVVNLQALSRAGVRNIGI